MDYKKKVIELFHDPTLKDLHFEIEKFRNQLESQETKRFDSDLIELLDSEDEAFLIFILELIGVSCQIMEAKDKLVDLLTKDIVFQGPGHVLDTLFVCFQFLDIKETVPFICKYLDSIYSKGHYKGIETPFGSPAIFALIELEPLQAIVYLANYIPYLDKMIDLDEDQSVNYAIILFNLIKKTGISGLRKITEKVAVFEDFNHIQFFCEGLDFIISADDDILSQDFSVKMFEEVKKAGSEIIESLQAKILADGNFTF